MWLCDSCFVAPLTGCPPLSAVRKTWANSSTTPATVSYVPSVCVDAVDGARDAASSAPAAGTTTTSNTNPDDSCLKRNSTVLRDERRNWWVLYWQRVYCNIAKCVCVEWGR